MKNLIYLLFLLGLFSVYSCTSSGNKKENAKEETKAKNACDEFLEEYEGWVDEYLEIIDRYFENPEDERYAQMYLNIIQEAAVWSVKWVNLVDCADEEEYKERFEAITKEVEDKMEELNL